MIDLQLYEIDIVSFPSGVDILKNLRILKLSVKELTTFGNVGTVVYFPKLEELELSITFQWVKENMKHFCDHTSFPNVQVLKLSLLLSSEEEIEDSFIIDLKQHFPLLQSSFLTFWYSRPTKHIISVIAGDTIRTLHLHFEDHFPLKVNVSSSTSLQNVQLENTFTSGYSFFKEERNCISMLTKHHIYFSEISNSQATLDIMNNFTQFIELKAIECSPTFTFSLQSHAAKVWLELRDSI